MTASRRITAARRPTATRTGTSGSTPTTGLRVAVVTAYPPGRNSLNEYGVHLVAALAGQHDVAEVVVLSDVPPPGADAAPPTSGGAPIAVRPCWRMNELRTLPVLIRELYRARPDAVIFNLQFATFGDRRLPGALGLFTPAVARLLGFVSVVLLHNLADLVDFQAAGFARGRAAARLLRAAGRVLTRGLLAADLVALTIPRYVEYVRRSYRARNVVLAPHGTFTELALAADGSDTAIPDGPRRIMAFGKWGTYKTVDVLVEAYQRLRDQGREDIELVLAGTDSPNSPGYMAGVAERHRDLPGLVLTGYVAEEDVAPLFRSAAVVAFPYTSTTGSSGVLHQAGEFGRAAVLPRIGDLIDVIEEEGFSGVYFTPGDATSLATALGTVLDDDDLRLRLARRNLAAAAGVPIAEVAHWYLLHLRRLTAEPSVVAASGKPGVRAARLGSGAAA